MDYREFQKWMLFFAKHKTTNQLLDIHLSNIEYLHSKNFDTKSKLYPEDFMIGIDKVEVSMIKNSRLYAELDKLG